MKRLLIILLLTSQVVHAEEGVVWLEATKPAPFSGFLLTKEKTDKLIDATIERDSLKRINSYLEQDNKVLLSRLDNDREHIKNLNSMLSDTKETSFLAKASFFVMGAVITGLISYGVVHTIR